MSQTDLFCYLMNLQSRCHLKHLANFVNNSFYKRKIVVDGQVNWVFSVCLCILLLIIVVMISVSIYDIIVIWLICILLIRYMLLLGRTNRVGSPWVEKFIRYIYKRFNVVFILHLSHSTLYESYLNILNWFYALKC